LGPYLTKAKKTSTFFMAEDVEEHLGISKASVVDERRRKPLVWAKESEKLLGSMKMPWLVPACDREKLFPRGPFNAFQGCLIAGLVPTKTTSKARFDAYAYEFGTDSLPKWAFEFRVRSGKYKLNTAVQELNEKCDGDTEAQSCNAMLICLRGSKDFEAIAWLGGNNGQYIRVAVLLAGAI